MQRALHNNYGKRNIILKRGTSPDMFTPHLELSGKEPKGENISTMGVPKEIAYLIVGGGQAQTHSLLP